MNVTATMAMEIPTMIFVVSGSPNISVPTTMAVMGSKTPRTDALVAPIFREAMARVAVETMVGNRASPTRLIKPVCSGCDSGGYGGVGTDDFSEKHNCSHRKRIEGKQ